MVTCLGKYRLDAFKGCGKEFRKYENVGYRLCVKCNSRRLRNNRKPKVPTGEAKLFKEIWHEREHKSFISGESLDKFQEGKDLWYNLFAHVLSKAQNKYPKFKLHKLGIVLLTPTEHYLYDQGTRDQREKHAKDNGFDWDKLYTLRLNLINDYRKLEFETI